MIPFQPPLYIGVAKFTCPHVLDDHKMSEDNQQLRSVCPPDYHIFWKIILKIIVHTNSLAILFSPFPFPTNIYHFGKLKQIAYYMVLKGGQPNMCQGQSDFKFWLSSDYQLSIRILLPCICIYIYIHTAQEYNIGGKNSCPKYIKRRSSDRLFLGLI